MECVKWKYLAIYLGHIFELSLVLCNPPRPVRGNNGLWKLLGQVCPIPIAFRERLAIYNIKGRRRRARFSDFPNRIKRKTFIFWGNFFITLPEFLHDKICGDAKQAENCLLCPLFKVIFLLLLLLLATTVATALSYKGNSVGGCFCGILTHFAVGGRVSLSLFLPPSRWGRVKKREVISKQDKEEEEEANNYSPARYRIGKTRQSTKVQRSESTIISGELNIFYF